MSHSANQWKQKPKTLIFTTTYNERESIGPLIDQIAATIPMADILVVDDNSDAATSLALLLEMENCEVRTAADGEEALAQVEAFQPELIFMDLAMPRLDGVAATQRIRALPQCQRVRIVALTGWGQPTDRQRTRLSRAQSTWATWPTMAVSFAARSNATRTID